MQNIPPQLRAEYEMELQVLEERTMRLVKLERLGAISLMFPGYLNQFNNSLNGAFTFLNILRKKIPSEQQADYAELLAGMKTSLEEVKVLLSNLSQAQAKHPTPVIQVVKDLDWFRKDTVEIKTEVADHQTILANKDRLIYILWNLFDNSYDSLKTKSFTAAEKPTIWVTGRVDNGQSILTVRDNGCGIDPEHLAMVFEPFFTTKDVGVGQGLGLFICKNIVEEYGGKISVISEPGKFCEFTLEFPEAGGKQAM